MINAQTHLGALVTNSLVATHLRPCALPVTSVAEKTSGKASVLSKIPKCAAFHAKFKVMLETHMSMCYLHVIGRCIDVEMYT